MMQSKKYLTYRDALDAMQKYCAKQEKCQKDIRTKLIQGGIYGEDLENVLAELITDGFIDEERYARHFVSGKFKINKWGRLKIKQALEMKDISEYCIREGLKEIDEATYTEHIRHIIIKKIQSNTTDHILWDERIKLFNHLISKGYEKDIINPILDEFAERD